MKLKENQLYRRTDEVLYYLWDPIGVCNEPGARDEYSGYLPQIYNMLIKNESKDMIAEYLNKIVTENMGLKKNHKHTMEIVDILLAYKEIIDNYKLSEELVK